MNVSAEHFPLSFWHVLKKSYFNSVNTHLMLMCVPDCYVAPLFLFPF